MSAEVSLRVRNLQVALPDGQLLVSQGVDLDLVPGRCVALVGESGSGKSLTARSLLGLAGDGLTTTWDVLDIEGQDARAFTRNDWEGVRGKFVGLVLQDALTSLDPLRTLGSEVGESLSAHRLGNRSERRSKAVELLRQVGVREPERRVDDYPHQLSGGQRQRVLIASAIAADAKVIVADEPTTALDVTVQKRVLSVLRGRLEEGAALLLISHDLAVVSEFADEILVMEQGKVVERGPAPEVLRSPRHPYTRKLIAAVPTPDSHGHYLARFEVDECAPGGVRREVAPPRRSAEEVVLEGRGLTKVYGSARDLRRGRGFRALDGVDFTVRRGETLGIVGESGSGKSTLLKLALGFLTPTTGELLLHGRPWSSLAERERRPRRGVAQLVSQDPLSSFDPRYDVGRIVEEALLRIEPDRERRRRRVLEVLDQVQLPGAVAERHPRSLSGGQRQRVAIARALAPAPELIFCDEPVSALDVSVQAQVLDLLVDLQADNGTTLVFVSHDLGVVRHVADRVLVLEQGRVVEEGDVAEVFSRPRADYTRELLDSVPRLAV